ncbi:MAG: ArsR family transcriptional regulator [Desulfarculus sp.]|jgi:ArsR family transcriptional regulator|nr:MAG: ArsR family transcriptional regulator [Desulfarculus sp.]
MDAKTKLRMEARARVLKAMAHPSRLFIVEQLKQKERCVAELAQAVGADVSTVSKHLSLLKSVGIVDDRKQGTQVFYRLKAPCVLEFFGCVEKVLQTNLQEQIMLVK